jgi:Zn-dependent protease
MVFGYAKPVPINPYNFKNPKKGMAFSSLAGPGINMVMAITFSFLLRVVMPPLESILPKQTWDWFVLPVTLMFGYGVIMNVVLAVLNMIPIPPLDGSRVVYWILPDKQAAAYYRLEPYGTLILMGLIMLGVLGRIIGPIIQPILALLLGGDIM